MRTPEEWNEKGHAGCAHRLEIQSKDQTVVDKLLLLANADKGYPLQLYCGSGKRAGNAQKILQHQGWTRVTNVGGWNNDETQKKVEEYCACVDNPEKDKTPKPNVHATHTIPPTKITAAAVSSSDRAIAGWMAVLSTLLLWTLMFV